MRRNDMLPGMMICLLMLGGCSKNDTRANTVVDPGPAAFRVVGYILRGTVLSDQPGMPDLGKVTHLNIAFMNPDSTGSFGDDESVKTLTMQAHMRGVAVLLSIGGGNPPAYLKSLLGAAHRSQLVQNLGALLDKYGCDGIDVDLEGDFIDGNYEAFVRSLGAVCKAKGKLITAAVATGYADSYTNAALTVYDFINIMSYDKTGPWDPGRPGPHAPMSMAVEDLAYWTGTRRIAKGKLTLGLPFYGYGFGKGAPEAMSYGDIVQQYPAARDSDQVTVAGGGIVYYNGAATIIAKTSLALKQAGGVMIWQLLQDAPGDNSLLKKIDSVVKKQ